MLPSRAAPAKHLEVRSPPPNDRQRARSPISTIRSHTGQGAQATRSRPSQRRTLGRAQAETCPAVRFAPPWRAWRPDLPISIAPGPLPPVWGNGSVLNSEPASPRPEGIAMTATPSVLRASTNPDLRPSRRGNVCNCCTLWVPAPKLARYGTAPNRNGARGLGGRRRRSRQHHPQDGGEGRSRDYERGRYCPMGARCP